MALFNSMLAMQMQEAASLMMRNNELNWAAMPLSGVFETTDGAVVVVGAFKENPLRDICNAFEIEDYGGVKSSLEAAGREVVALGAAVGQMFVRDDDGNVVELIQPGGRLGRSGPAPG